MWTAFESYDLDCQQIMDGLVSFTCEPIIAISVLTNVLKVPEDFKEESQHLLKTYVSRAAFAGSEIHMPAPSARFAQAHGFLLKVGAIEKSAASAPASASLSATGYQLTDAFVPGPAIN